MGKTRAQIQKEYRERKKQREGEAYLKKERQRRMTYYIPSSELSKSEKKKRNVSNRERVQKHRTKKKLEAQAERQAVEMSPVSDTSGYDSVNHPASQDNQAMVVRMNFEDQRRAGTRRRISRALARAHKSISQLQIRNSILERKYKCLQKRSERKRKLVPSRPATPRSKTDKDLLVAGISLPQGDQVRRQLLLGNAVLSEIALAKTEAGKKKNKEKTLHSLVCGKIIKKYRGLGWLARRTGMNRNKLGKAGEKWTVVPKQSRSRLRFKYRREVDEFFQRDDNSRAQPGKADSKRCENGEKIQTRVLTDYLSNLHKKFLSEQPTCTLSLATFCRMRPQNILTTYFISRSSCLCTRHQNMALLLKSLKRQGVMVPVNPDAYAKQHGLDDDEMLDKLPETLVVGQWKRVDVMEKGRKKSVMRIVDTEIERTRLLTLVKSQTAEFKEHVTRVQTQYEELRRLKQHLPPNNMVLQMDFAENYSCKSVEEIQSAYWNQTSVTLHPVVAYFRQRDSLILQHKSFVIISEELAHTSSAVHAIIKKIMPELRALDPNLAVIHYWTDGPTSQYRNKQIFHTVANHLQMFDVKARWNYFEVGHGKGPCDGLGGTTKRMADEAVRSGRTVIQDAKDFMSWATTSSMKGIKFIFVSSDEVAEAQVLLSTRDVKVLKGTFKVHAVTGLGNSRVAVRDVSCYCSTCLEGDVCDTWRTEFLTSGTERSEPKQTTPLTQSTPRLDISIGDFVAAVYESEWYIGKVVSVDNDDDEIEITFLEKKKSLYQWPRHDDVIWISNNDVICKIDQPVPSGKSERMLKIDNDDYVNITSAFQALVASK